MNEFVREKKRYISATPMFARVQLCLSLVALTTMSGTLASLSDHCVRVGEYKPPNSCCKVEKLWGRDDTLSISHFSCSNGCCGEPDNQYCCGGKTSGGINKEALPYVIGFSIFGVLVLIGVTILLVWVFRKVCSAVRDQSDNRQAMKGLKEQLEVALVQSGDRPMRFKDLFSTTPAPPPTSSGAIVHELTKASTISTLSSHSFGLRANLPSRRPDLNYSAVGGQSTRHAYGSDAVAPSAPLGKNYAYNQYDDDDVGNIEGDAYYEGGILHHRDGRPLYPADLSEINLGMDQYGHSQFEHGSDHPPSYQSHSQFGAAYVPPPTYHETMNAEFRK